MPTLTVDNGFSAVLTGLGKNRPFAHLSKKRVSKKVRQALREEYGEEPDQTTCTPEFVVPRQREAAPVSCSSVRSVLMTDTAPQLVACPRCGHQVLSRTTLCPTCGYRFSSGELTYWLRQAIAVLTTRTTRLGQLLGQVATMLTVFVVLTVVYFFVLSVGFGLYFPKPPATSPSTPSSNQTLEESFRALQRSVAQYEYETWRREHPTMEQNAPAVLVAAAAFLSALSLSGYRRLKRTKRTAP